MDLYLFRQEQQTGPYTEADARALVVAGEIEQTCLAWQEGMAEWIPGNQVLDLSIQPMRSPVGLPPVPAHSRPEMVTASVSSGAKPSAEPIKPMKPGTKINVYGGNAITAVVAVFVILRWLAGCHLH